MSYRRLGDMVKFISNKNTDGNATVLFGINIDKFFMPSVANIIGVDLKKYKLVKKYQFACNRMHVGRDERLPISMSTFDYDFIVSPAYDVFEVTSSDVLPEYLMLWFRRKEFDRQCWFCTDADVRGGLHLDALKSIEIKVPSIEEQRQIVAQYQSIANKIKVNEQICEKLEAAAQALYKHWFVDFEFPYSPPSEGCPQDGVVIEKTYKSSGGKMVWNEELGKEIPEGWKVKSLGEISKIITKGTTPKEMSFLKNDYYSIPFIKGETINENHTLNNDKTSYINDNIHNADLKRSIIYKHDILFSIAGTLGKYSIYEENHNANCNQAVALIRSNKAKYIYWNFLANEHKEYFNFNIQQAVQANYSLDTVSNYRLLVAKDNDLVDFFTTKIYYPILNFRVQSQKLTQLQSLLLSRLAVGEEAEAS